MDEYGHDSGQPRFGRLRLGDMDEADSNFDRDDGTMDTATEPIWLDFDGENPQRAHEEPYSSAHPSQDPSVVSSSPGSSSQTERRQHLSVDNIDWPAEETIAESLSRPLSLVPYGERIYRSKGQST
ncbi:hypothetical protein ARMGADRAFT_1074999 [Armillaria gallica]|uniref:Uncharacterized protein n=1 Tax=Armillaria gallica TaxID=47427 RepID=A0A2H3E9T7_ARMGA|nr:hypothetical protein ARMGADRAFT_1074999 [Armillaria gallica]